MSLMIRKTTSVCPVCLQTVNARTVVGNDGFIHMEKSCEKHGSFDALIWEGDIMSYLSWAEGDQEGCGVKKGRQVEKGCPHDCGLCRDHQSEACCVLLELTKRCNLHCPVCFASAGEGESSDPSIDEIRHQYEILKQQGRAFNIQLSGGEPTLRDDLDEIIRLGRESGFSYFQLNTNGLRIAAEEGYAQRLRDMGVSCVFLQFDGCRDDVYETLRGQPLLALKQKAIKACEEAGLSVVLVPVIAAGVNEDQAGEILRFALQHHPAVRGVHFQPLSTFGRCKLPALQETCCGVQTQKRITIPRMLKFIEEQTGGEIKAEDFSGGGAESPYCSFHAAYRKQCCGSLKALKKRHNEACCPTPSSEARDFVMRQWGRNDSCCTEENSDFSSLDAFLREAVEQTFTVSGMVFQDAWDLDLDRLRRCYICEADSTYGIVPFCAYNLTDSSGKALYRR